MGNRPDLEKLRRFALAVGLILATLTFALEFDSSETVSPLGLPFKVVRPDLLPVGLALASVYGALRFWYYGIATATSPARKRRQDLERNYDHKYRRRDRVIATTISVSALNDAMQASFPRIPGARVEPIVEEKDLSGDQEALVELLDLQEKGLVEGGVSHAPVLVGHRFPGGSESRRDWRISTTRLPSGSACLRLAATPGW